MEKSSMPEEMIVWNTKVESDGVQIRGHGTGYRKRPKTVRNTSRRKSCASSYCYRRM